MTDKLFNILSKDVERITRSYGFGPNGSTTYALLHGISNQLGLPSIPQNTDSQGLVFFTKPCLNLSYDNVILHRKMRNLADPRLDSMGNYIRCLLNPPGFDEHGDKIRSIINNDRLAFMPISNFLISMSDPPDFVADTYTTKEGWGKEQVSMIESRPNINMAYDLNLTFANMDGDLINSIFSRWIEYGTRVFEGSMLPFPVFILNNMIDYQTRAYRIILDHSGRYVQKMYAPFAMYPYSNPEGAGMGYERADVLNTKSNELQITFKAIGAQYNDPVLIDEFNKITEVFHPDLNPAKRKTVTKVDGQLTNGVDKRQLLNFYVYPYINSDTMELEWWADNEQYATILQLLERPKV